MNRILGNGYSFFPSAGSKEVEKVSNKSRISARLFAKVSGLDQTFLSERIENPNTHTMQSILIRLYGPQTKQQSIKASSSGIHK